jgi:tetratricopeptide (TPR) repeat protein
MLEAVDGAASTSDDTVSATTGVAPPPASALAAALRDPSPAARLAAFGRALDEARTPARLLAMASTCMEVNDLDNAAALAAEAVAAAPGWAGARFELGKLWLRKDDMERAAAAFGEASALMPTFASAAANWGATLGELDRPEEALAAFSRALATDPANHQALNNLGVVSRELGRLAESEDAFRKVIALTPGLAFGHYNLGHTLFLQGRYHAAVAAYSAGQRNDPARNPVQASRLALARLATGDAAGALRELQTCTAMLPAAYRRQVLGDTHAVAWALLSTTPELPGWHLVGDWLGAELADG